MKCSECKKLRNMSTSQEDNQFYCTNDGEFINEDYIDKDINCNEFIKK